MTEHFIRPNQGPFQAFKKFNKCIRLKRHTIKTFRLQRSLIKTPTTHSVSPRNIEKLTLLNNKCTMTDNS